MKIKIKDKGAFVRFVRGVYTKEKTFVAVQKAINKKYGFLYNRPAIKYWVSIAFPEIWRAELKKQEDLMKRWRNDQVEESSLSKEEQFAESLDKLFKKEITHEEYITITS